MARPRKPSGRERSYGRRQGDRSIRFVHICCEGERTEYQYFQAWKNAGRVKEMSCHKRCKNVKEVCENVEQGEEVYWLFDTERPSDGVPVKEHRRLARQRGIQAIPSNPSFEYWLLLHFEETSGPFRSASELVGDLRKHIPQYDKSMNVYECIWGCTEEALERASRLRRNSGDAWDDDPNSSTHVDIVVRRLRDLEKVR